MSENSNSNKDSKKWVFENLWHNSFEEAEETVLAGEIKKLKSKGISVEDIAELYNLSKEKVYEYLRD